MPSNSELRKFKGWTKPGPVISRDQIDKAQASIDSTVTIDSLCGDYRIFQYSNGHRFSTDDVLVAWYASQNAPQRATALDMGCGLASVGMMFAWKSYESKLVGIEAQHRSLMLAEKSIELNGLQDRYELRHFDLRDPGALRDGEVFDVILTSPPYFAVDAGVLGNHPQKIECRFEIRGTVADYLIRAQNHLSPGGIVCGVFPTAQEPRLWEAFSQTSLFCLRYIEVILSEGEKSALTLFIGCHERDFPPTFVENCRISPLKDPNLTIRNSKGVPTREYLALKVSMGLPPTI